MAFKLKRGLGFWYLMWLEENAFCHVLLSTGRWGLSRHFHYVPEILAAFFWTVPALFNHVRVSLSLYNSTSWKLETILSLASFFWCSFYLTSMWYFLPSFFLIEQKGMTIDADPSKHSVISFNWFALWVVTC